MSITPDYVVTPEAISTAGLISYWRLSGSITLDALTVTWQQQGLDEKLLPKPISRETALGRAVREQAAKRRLVRPLAKHGAWAIVDEVIQNEKPYYETVMTIAYRNSYPDFTCDVGEALSAYQPIVDNITRAYARQQGELDSEDISAWLVKLGNANSSVALRDTGGIYFVPRGNVEHWRKIVAAIESVSSHRVYRIPAMKNSEAIDAITAAVTAEAEGIVLTMEQELQRAGDDTLGQRALKTRAAQCRELLAKVSTYDELLGTQLKVRERIDSMMAMVAAAALVAEQEPAAA